MIIIFRGPKKNVNWECLLSGKPDIPGLTWHVRKVLQLPFRKQLRIGNHRSIPVLQSLVI